MNELSVKSQRPRRIFSLKEANLTLPLVARIIRDIVDGHRRISELDAQAHRLAEGGQCHQAEEMRDQIHELLLTVDGFVDELHQIGCEFKDPYQGLVDFPARMNGDRLVYLCWKMGESEIRYWHEIHAGFAGRQPVEGYFAAPAAASQAKTAAGRD